MLASTRLLEESKPPHYRHPPLISVSFRIVFDLPDASPEAMVAQLAQRELPGWQYNPSRRIFESIVADQWFSIRELFAEGDVDERPIERTGSVAVAEAAGPVNGRAELDFHWDGGFAGNPYPRYEVLRDALINTVDWLGDCGCLVAATRPGLTAWELTYWNRVPRGTVWNTPADWSFFRLFPERLPRALPELVDCHSEWRFAAADPVDEFRVTWDSDEPAADAMNVDLRLSASGVVSSEDPVCDAVLAGFDAGRKLIVEQFCVLVSDAANAYWGLKT